MNEYLRNLVEQSDEDLKEQYKKLIRCVLKIAKKF